MWLGPRPERPYQANIAPYKFRWWQLYSSQMANWGVHYLDAIRWLTGELAPASICAMGGRFAVDDDRTIPDTLEVTLRVRLGPAGRLRPVRGQRQPDLPAAVRRDRAARHAGHRLRQRAGRSRSCPSGAASSRTARRGWSRWRSEAAGGNDNLTAQHARNFLDCVKSREKPNADVEIGHRSTTMSLLANISLATGERLEWDAEKEQITNNPEANELLHYEYRKPWKLG